MATQNYQNRMSQSSRESQSEPSLISRCCELTEENPMGATLAAFGVGVGLGAMIGAMLGEPATASKSRRQTAEALGRRMLDSVADSLPESVRRYVS
jgi:hypothetical protein